MDAMKSFRYRGLGLFAAMLIAGGCQSSNKPAATGKPPAADIQTQPTDDSHWKVDAGPTPEQALAKRTADYASQLQANGTTPDLAESDPSRVQFPRRGRKIVTIPLDDGEPPAATIPPPRNDVAELNPVAPKPRADAAFPPRISPRARHPQAARDTAPVDPNQAATVDALKHAVESNPLSDEPVTLPESADFATAKPDAKPGSMSDVSALEYRLQKRARENPHDIAAQLDLQLYAMLNDDPSPELAAVTLLPHDDREMINTLIDGLTDFRSAVREDQTMLQAKKIRPLIEMAERLRSQADLAVPTVALCSRVVGFGEYTAITPARFPAGRESKVIVYCEVENFESKKVDADMWETRLTQQVTIFTDTGQYVWADKPRGIVDQSHRRRHDFYAYELLRLPADLTIGRYLLKVTITDENAGKVAEETVPVSIAATESNGG
jgi:hypothetical protein